MSAAVLTYALGTLALGGALTVVFAREVMRLAIGLGAFLLALAGLFAVYGFGFLALAEVFVYVGGVLVLLLFAIMLVHRPSPGAPALETRHDALAAVTAVALGALTVSSLRDVAFADPGSAPQVAGGIDALGTLLLGDMLPHFELAGALLLAALVAVVVVAEARR